VREKKYEKERKR